MQIFKNVFKMIQKKILLIKGFFVDCVIGLKLKSNKIKKQQHILPKIQDTKNKKMLEFAYCFDIEFLNVIYFF